MTDPATALTPLHQRIRDYCDIRIAQLEADRAKALKSGRFNTAMEHEIRLEELEHLVEFMEESKILYGTGLSDHLGVMRA